MGNIYLIESIWCTKKTSLISPLRLDTYSVVKHILLTYFILTLLQMEFSRYRIKTSLEVNQEMGSVSGPLWLSV